MRKKKWLTFFVCAILIGNIYGVDKVQAEETNNAGDFNVTNGTAGTEWTYDDSGKTLTFNESGTYTVTGDGNATTEKIVVADNFDGTIQVKNIHIDVSANNKQCAFSLGKDVNLTLVLEGENTLKSGADQPGLSSSNVPEGSDKYLTITSSPDFTSGLGRLTAVGNDGGAGIGCAYNITGGTARNIKITNGVINATGGTSTGGGGAGIGGGAGGDRGCDGENIVITGGTVTAKGGSDSSSSQAYSGGAGIGGGGGGAQTTSGCGKNITITGGVVSATGGGGTGSDQASKRGGAGIGGAGKVKSDNTENNGAGIDITITGGTVSATGDFRAAGIGGGGCTHYTGAFGGIGKNIKITGGTVTAIANASPYAAYAIGNGSDNTTFGDIVIDGGSVMAASISGTPKNQAGENVYLAKLPKQANVDCVTVDGGTQDEKEFIRQGDHPMDPAFYLYLSGKDHSLLANGKAYGAVWDSAKSSFAVKPKAPAPTSVSSSSQTTDSITVEELPDTATYGDGEYSIDGAAWQDSNVLTGLKPNTAYTVYARYKGNATYAASDYGTASVSTKALPKYSVELKIGKHGSVRADGVSYGASQTIMVEEGKEQTYEIIPDTGYQVEKAAYQGQEISGKADEDIWTFTAPAIEKDGMLLEVSFQKKSVPPVISGSGSDNGSGSDVSASEKAVKTSDNRNLVGIVTLLLISGIAVAILYRKKQNL